MDLLNHSKSRPSTYATTVTTDQITISRHEYDALLDTKFRLRQANEVITELKGEVSMLKEVMNRMLGFYNINIASIGPVPTPGGPLIEDSLLQQNEVDQIRPRTRKKNNRRDSGVDGVDIPSNGDDEEGNGEAEPQAVKGMPTIDHIQTQHNQEDEFDLAFNRQTEPQDFNLLDFGEDEEFAPASNTTRSIAEISSLHVTEEPEKRPFLFPHVDSYSSVPVSSPSPPSPPSPPPAPQATRKILHEPEPTPLIQTELGYQSPEEEEERPPTPASWEKPPKSPEVTFEFNPDDWQKSASWDPSPGLANGHTVEPERANGVEKDTTVPAKPSRPLPQTARLTVRPHMVQPADSSPPPPNPISPPVLKTARQLYLEKKTLRALAESHPESLATTSNASSSGEIDKAGSESDPNTFRHIYIPNLPPNSTLSTLSSVIRTNGQGGVESISLFRQKAGDGENNYEESGNGESIGANISFTSSEACDAWFKFLFENSSQKLQGNLVKTWLFPSEDSASEWLKCAVFRRHDYHPSIAGKIERAGPGGQASLQEALKKGATRVLRVSGLPPDVTESDLAFLTLPPGNRTRIYEGPTHLASGQAGLATEEFARWKWLEKVEIVDEIFGFDGEPKKTALVFTAGVKTAYLARGKIWKHYNTRNPGRGLMGHVKVEFVRDECNGPLEELPPWVVVAGDDDSDLDLSLDTGIDAEE